MLIKFNAGKCEVEEKYKWEKQAKKDGFKMLWRWFKFLANERCGK